MQVVGDANVLAHEADHRVLRQVRVGFGIVAAQHLDAAEEQEGTEDVENPIELLHQGRAQTDHDRAQHDDPENAPEQHAVLVLTRDVEVAEDHRHDEDVVHRQRLLHQEAGVVLHRLGTAELPPDPAAEGDADTEIAGIQQQALAHLDFMLIAMQHAEVEYQKGDDQYQKGQPEPAGGTEDGGCQKGK